MQELASRYGIDNIAKLLIDAGADINVSAAVGCGNENVAKLLIAE